MRLEGQQQAQERVQMDKKEDRSGGVSAELPRCDFRLLASMTVNKVAWPVDFYSKNNCSHH